MNIDRYSTKFDAIQRMADDHDQADKNRLLLKSDIDCTLLVWIMENDSLPIEIYETVWIF